MATIAAETRTFTRTYTKVNRDYTPRYHEAPNGTEALCLTITVATDTPWRTEVTYSPRRQDGSLSSRKVKETVHSIDGGTPDWLETLVNETSNAAGF